MKTMMKGTSDVLVTVLAIALLGAASLSGCRKEEPPDEAGILVSQSPTPSSYDPISSNKSYEVTLLALLHDSLVRWDAAAEKLVAALAERWEQSADRTEWLFHLRKARTPAGTELKAEDVCFSFDLHANPDFRSMARANFMVDDELFRCRVVAQDTVAFGTGRPYAFVPENLSEMTVLPKGQFVDLAGQGAGAWRRMLDRTVDTSSLQGFGPFQVASMDANPLRLRKNPNDYGRDADRVTQFRKTSSVGSMSVCGRTAENGFFAYCSRRKS